MATGYVPGPDLQTVVADYGALPERSLLVLANRLALALGAIHDAGLAHRDLKPSNVLVAVDGPRVIDFGIARALHAVSDNGFRTSTGAVIGSPGFMSPEQVRGLEVGPQSDVFSLGAVLAYAATGRPPFGSHSIGLHARLFRVSEEEPDLEGMPEGVLGLVRQCLEKAPEKRPTPMDLVARAHPRRAGAAMAAGRDSRATGVTCGVVAGSGSAGKYVECACGHAAGRADGDSTECAGGRAAAHSGGCACDGSARRAGNCFGGRPDFWRPLDTAECPTRAVAVQTGPAPRRCRRSAGSRRRSADRGELLGRQRRDPRWKPR
ncbi:hypothetical protein GCM10009647_082470 [Streptomyces sanglieri]